MRKQVLRSLALSLLAALALTAMAGLGLLAGPDGVVSDALYHHSSATDGEIVVIVVSRG